VSKNYRENGFEDRVMLCSVIVPTRNRATSLGAALRSFCAQTLPHDQFEVLVIDNGSTDNTKEVVDSLLPEFVNLRYFFAPEPGLHVGRHKGLFEAQTDILVYADDDIVAFPSWLEGVVESFQDPTVVLTGGNNHPLFQMEPPWWFEYMWRPDSLKKRWLPILSILDFGEEVQEIEPDYVWGCNFSIRKDVLLEAGGFHPDGMPQDLIHLRGDGESSVSTFIKGKRYKALFNPKASIHHVISEERMSVNYFKRRAFHHGISDSYTQIRLQSGVHTAPKSIHRHFQDATTYLRAMLHTGKIAYAASLNATQIFPYFCLTRSIRAAYNQGYAFHQEKVRKDPSLLEWVLKSSYY
jgi:glycosyltransferase involved in cell wall biosynthesis